MRHISASEASQNLNHVLEAAQQEPVVIQQQNRGIAVILSMEDYERLIAIHIADFQRFCDEVGKKAQEHGLTEEKLQQLLADS